MIKDFWPHSEPVLVISITKYWQIKEWKLRAIQNNINMKRVNIVLLAIYTIIASAESKNNELVRSKTVSRIEPLVIGGQNATKGQFPYQASLRLKINLQHFCGASIISDRFLLTAAHCVDDTSSPDLLVAVIGALHVSHGGIVMNIDKLKQHERWDVNRLINDIALLRTAKKIAFCENIQPIALPSQNLPSEGFTPVLLSGWGEISNNVSESFNFYPKLNGILSQRNWRILNFREFLSSVQLKCQTFCNSLNFIQLA